MARPKFKPQTKIPTPEETATIKAGIDADPDTVVLDKEWFDRARPASEVVPHIVEAHRRRKELEREYEKSREKTMTYFVMDTDVFEHFKSSGPDWKERVNEILRRAAFGDEARS